MIQFKNLWTLKIRHDYFEDGKCHWGNMQLSQHSVSLLNRRHCRWMQTDIAEWKLVSCGEAALDDADALEMDFVCSDPGLFYNTQWDWKADGTCRQLKVGIDSDRRIEMKTLPGEKVTSTSNAYFQLAVSLQGADDEPSTVTELAFEANALYWEYWLIPRDGNMSRKLELEMTGGGAECSLDRCEDADNPLNIPLHKFRTSVPLKLTERGRERIVLYEMLPSGIRRPLIRSLPLPVQGQVPCKRRDTVVAIVYF